MRSGQMQQQNTIAHTTENQPPRTASNTISGPRASGGEPIDTAKFDGVIAEAERPSSPNRTTIRPRKRSPRPISTEHSPLPNPRHANTPPLSATIVGP